LFFVLCFAVAEPRADESFFTFDIPASRASTGLALFAEQSSTPLIYLNESVRDKQTNRVAGRYTVPQALDILLRGTGIAGAINDRGVLTVKVAEPGDDRGSEMKGTPENGSDPRARRNIFTEVAVVVLSIFIGHSAVSQEAIRPAAGPSASVIEEVVVTANRREQLASDVAGGIQVFRGDELDRLGADGFEDYLLSVPGVSFRDQGAGARRISLRGISNFAGSDNGITAPASTVGLYLNDISIVDTSNLPDIALYDLQRIEVLKGPQGTLYGEGAMGGAIKMVLSEPIMDAFEAQSDATLSGTEDGGFNYRLRGAVNIPLLTDRLALRVAGTYQDEDGFIDNVANGEEDHNNAKSYSVRAYLFGRLTDKLTAEVLALHNAQDQDQFDQMDPSLGDLKISSVEPLFNEVNNDLFGLTLKYDLGFATLTSISSYYSANREQLIRVPVLATPVFGTFGSVTQDPLAFDMDLDTVSQEFRAVSQGDNRLDWVIGGFFREKEQRGIGHLFIAPSDLPSVNAGLAAAMLPTLPESGEHAGDVFFNDTIDTYKQFAAYGEINFEIIDNLELTAGFRWFDEEVLIDNTFIGFSILAGASATDSTKFSDSDVVPKVGLAYHVTEDHTVYAQAAKGFRSGIININRSLGVGGVAAKSDNLWNYELGAKTRWADGRLVLNGSLFYVDWTDVQTIQTEISPISNTPIGFFGNSGDAEIVGLEIELAAAPVDNAVLGITFGYMDSEMTKAVPDAIEGVILPNVPEITASAFGEYRFSLWEAQDGYARLDVQYVDEQATRPITTSNDGSFVDPYTLGNFRVGFERQRWGMALFVNNLWDERAELGRGVTGAGPIFNLERFTVARPRTFGVTLSANY
jgi:outer membrane receptor protein involved in Fe transport